MEWRNRYAFLAALVGIAASTALLPALASAATIGMPQANLGLVGYWPLDGNTTNWKTGTTEDISGNGNTANLINMSTTTSPVQGEIGQALQFNGGDLSDGSYIEADTLAISQAADTQGTISLWFNPQSTSASVYPIFNFAYDLRGTTYVLGVRYTYGSINLLVKSSSTLTSLSFTFSNDSKWHILSARSNHGRQLSISEKRRLRVSDRNPSVSKDIVVELQKAG